MKVTSEALIDAPPEDVFSFVSDPARRPEFIPSLAENRNAYPEDRLRRAELGLRVQPRWRPTHGRRLVHDLRAERALRGPDEGNDRE